MRWSSAAWVLLAWLTWLVPAAAAPPIASEAASVDVPPASSPDQLLSQGRAAEERGEFSRALTLYGMLLDQAPQSRPARHARRRRAYLEARSERAFGPLRALTAIRKDVADRTALDAFAARVPSFPEGLNRREAWQLLADSYLKQHDDPAAALAAYRAWLKSPNLPEAERQLAASGAALARGRLEGSSTSLADMRDQNLGHRAEAILLRSQEVHRVGAPVAWGLLALFAGLGLSQTKARGLRPEALRQAFASRRLLAGLWLLLVPLVLVFRYDHSLAPQFAWLVGGLAITLALAAVVAAGKPPEKHRRMLAALSAVAALAAAFLAADHSQLLLDVMLSLEQKPS